MITQNRSYGIHANELLSKIIANVMTMGFHMLCEVYDVGELCYTYFPYEGFFREKDFICLCDVAARMRFNLTLQFDNKGGELSVHIRIAVKSGESTGE